MKIIDLSQKLSEGMDVYPGDPDVHLDQIHTLESHEWRLRYLQLGSHTGTHVDAPSHMHEHGKTLDELPLDKFIGHAQVCDKDADFPSGMGLVFRSGKIDIDLLAKIQTSQPPFVVIGDEAELTVDMERELLALEIITFTDLVNLSALPEDPFLFVGLPLHIQDGDGSPIRACAIIE